MNATQTISTPFGVVVFGSSIVRVAPDMASLQFAVIRIEQQPKDAFGAAREGAQQVQRYLSQAGITDFGLSHVSLSTSFRNKQFEGYRAGVRFHVMLHELHRMEEVLTGVIEAGANELWESAFQTSRLKEIRVETRRQAVKSARQKAQIYAEAAGVQLGPGIHIDDANPDMLGGGHDLTRPAPQIEEDTPHAFDPGSIVVGAAVWVAFALRS